MDFSTLMAAQIAKAKLPIAAGQQKYIKRSEIEAQRQADYEAEQRQAEQARFSRAEQKRKLEEEETAKEAERKGKKQRLADESRKIQEEDAIAAEIARRKHLGLPPLPKSTSAHEEAPIPGEDDITDEDLFAKLRDLNEPARLFDESHTSRLRRYRRLAQRLAAPVMSTGPIPTTLELLPEADMKVPDAVPKEVEPRRYVYRQLASYFTMVLSEWQYALEKRDESIKTSTSGQAAYNAMAQARANMVPLFRRLEKGDLEDSILEPIVEIVRWSQRRRYVDANDAYLRLSIGKAAWPIGVTMVGIHERSAREKLHANDKDAAHIMSDEVTRKFLQSIKRCLTFAQTRWPPDDGGWM